VSLLAWNAPASAIPAYARRYDLACSTCHAPMPPRLNNVGEVFRRWGFRLPDADENGNLIQKIIPAHGIGDAGSIIGTFHIERAAEKTPGENQGTMTLDEITLVAGTSIGDHYSTQVIFLPRNSEGGTELENAEFQGNLGKPANQWSLRAGLLQTNLWKRSHDGALTLALPIVFDDGAAPAPVGDFAGFAMGINQIGAEAGYTHTRLSKGSLWSTMVSAAAYNGVQETGDFADHNVTGGVDVFLQALQYFGSRNSGGVFYYDGRTVVDPLGQLPTPGPFSDRYKRYGAEASYSPLDRIDLDAVYLSGKDDSQELARDVTLRGGYAQITGRLIEHWIAIYRWEQVDPDIDTGGDLIRSDVLSTTYQALDNVFLTAEYNEIKTGDVKGHTVIGSVKLAF
jgi:hypothetical protein